MLSLIRADAYRLLHKRSLYIYFGSIALLYTAVSYIRSGGFDALSAISEANNAFSLLPGLVGGYFFAAVYTDDLGSGNLATLVGKGLGKASIVIAKTVLMALALSLAFALATALLLASQAAYGWLAAPDVIQAVLLMALRYLMATVGYAVLAGIAVYGLKQPTFAMVLFIMLAFNVLGGLINAVLMSAIGGQVAEAIADRLLFNITARFYAALVLGGQAIQPLIEYLAYLAIAGTASVLAFIKTETEFKA